MVHGNSQFFKIEEYVIKCRYQPSVFFLLGNFHDKYLKELKYSYKMLNIMANGFRL